MRKFSKNFEDLLYICLQMCYNKITESNATHNIMEVKIMTMKEKALECLNEAKKLDFDKEDAKIDSLLTDICDMVCIDTRSLYAQDFDNALFKAAELIGILPEVKEYINEYNEAIKESDPKEYEKFYKG